MELQHSRERAALVVYVDFDVTSANVSEFAASFFSVLAAGEKVETIRFDLCGITQGASCFFGFLGDVTDRGVIVELASADEQTIRTLETLGVPGVKVVS